MKSIKALKYLGQNFLRYPQIAKKIVALLGNINEKNIYEIGPGTGALTEHLVNTDANIICFEKDIRAIEYLKNKFEKAKKLSIIHTDIRKVNIDKKVSIIGNIPYNITNDILFWLIDNSYFIDCAILTIQREVAQRYTANPNTKEYGITTLALQLYGKAKICFHIPASAFSPTPKVTSSVIIISFDNELYKNINKKELIKFIRAAFSTRRKVLSNSLRQYFLEHNIDVPKLETELSEINKNYLRLRAEQLTLADYILFYDTLKDKEC